MIETRLLPRRIIRSAEQALTDAFHRCDLLARWHTDRLLQAFAEEGLQRSDLIEAAGYGHDDPGRDKFDRIVAKAFGAEAALVRLQFVAGTHALAIALHSLLKPGDEVLSLTGAPFPTLEAVFGIERVGDAWRDRAVPGSLSEKGIHFKAVELTPDGLPDLSAIAQQVTPQTRLFFIQRAKGFEWRPGLSMRQMKEVIAHVRAIAPGIPVFVDNCYGEFTQAVEPLSVGADLIAGSLIKNPGGGLAPSGGYIAGRREWVDRAAVLLTAPGIGRRGGATFHATRLLAQGFFEAPHKVAQAVKIRLLFAHVFDSLGYSVMAGEPPADTNLAIRLRSRDQLLAFSDQFNRACPVNAGGQPEPCEAPGYDLPLVCSEGSFLEGATAELSCDAIWRDPATVYINGGLNYEHGRLALERLLRSHPWV